MTISLNQQIMAAVNTCEGTEQNLTKDKIFNLSCIPSGIFFVFKRSLCSCIDAVKGSANKSLTLNGGSHLQGLLKEWYRQLQVFSCPS